MELSPKLLDELAGLPFGQRVKKLRRRRGLTQVQLADMCDLSAVYVRKLESGERKPTGFALVARIAEALSVPVEVMLSGVSSVRLDLRVTTAARQRGYAAVRFYRLIELPPGQSPLVTVTQVDELLARRHYGRLIDLLVTAAKGAAQSVSDQRDFADPAAGWTIAVMYRETACLAAVVGQTTRAQEVVRLAMGHARQAGEPGMLTDLHVALSDAFLATGNYVDAQRSAEDGVASGEGDPFRQDGEGMWWGPPHVHAYLNAAMAARRRGRDAEFRAHLQAVEDALTAAPDNATSDMGCLFGVVAAVEAGNADLASRRSWTALQLERPDWLRTRLDIEAVWIQEMRGDMNLAVRILRYLGQYHWDEETRTSWRLAEVVARLRAKAAPEIDETASGMGLD